MMVLLSVLDLTQVQTKSIAIGDGASAKLLMVLQ